MVFKTMKKVFKVGRGLYRAARGAYRTYKTGKKAYAKYKARKVGKLMRGPYSGNDSRDFKITINTPMVRNTTQTTSVSVSYSVAPLFYMWS